MCVSHLAPIESQKTMQLASGGHANSNGMTIVPSNETTDLAHFHAKQRLTQSTPGSPQEHARSTSNEPVSIEVVGSAESLVGKVRSILYVFPSIHLNKIELKTKLNLFAGSCRARTR